MALQPKSVVYLVAALVVGFALGLFTDARLIRSRRDRRIPPARRNADFYMRIEDAVQPHSDAQRDSIHRVIQKVADDNRSAMLAAANQTRARSDSLRVRLAPMLDAGQRARLDTVLGTGVTLRGVVRVGAPAGGRPPR